MKYALLMSFTLICSCASFQPRQQIKNEQPLILQCKILCQGGDTYSYSKGDLHCQCDAPPTPEIQYNVMSGYMSDNGAVLTLPNGKTIQSKVSK